MALSSTNVVLPDPRVFPVVPLPSGFVTQANVDVTATVAGAGSGVVSVPLSFAAAGVAEPALAQITAAITALPASAVSFSGTVPAGGFALLFDGSATNAAIVPANSSLSAFVATGGGITTLVSAQTGATTIVAGSGGLTYTQSAASVTGSLIVASGGSSAIDLAAGANTVAIDSASAGGIASVNALAGGASVIVNSSGLLVSPLAVVDAAHNDAVAIFAPTLTYLADATNAILVQDGGVALFANASSSQVASDIYMASGNETIGVLTGSAATLTGATASLGIGHDRLFMAADPNLDGTRFIDPNAQNVKIFGGGATTLFGSGDAAGTVNTGFDAVFGGQGFFHAGTAGLSLLASAADITGPATTLIGGGAGDALYAQSADVMMQGAAGTALMDAAGITVAGGAASIGGMALGVDTLSDFSFAGAPGGDTLNAGASNAVMFGAVGGANTIISGSGSATVFGHAGTAGGAGNVYLDGAAGGRLTITDFLPADVFRLTGSQSVASVSPSGASVMLTDGTTITLFGGVVNTGNVGSYFHA